MPDFTKWSLTEALSNSKAKSSLGLLLGLLFGLLAIAMYLLGSFMAIKGIIGFENILTQAFLVLSASATLVGVRYFKKDKDLVEIIKEDKQEVI